MNNKNFGKRYNEVYKSGLQNSIWPWSSVVSLLHKLDQKIKGKVNLLEIGPGMGANINLIKSLNYDYYGIEFSSFAVEKIIHAHPDLSEKIVAGDFTKKINYFGNKKFDIILDRASLTCNSTSKIKNCIDLIGKNLNENGFFIGVDWYSSEHSAYLLGNKGEDEYSMIFKKYDDIFDPPRMHFSTKQHIFDLFQKYEIVHLEHNKRETMISDIIGLGAVASWNFIAMLKV